MEESTRLVREFNNGSAPIDALESLPGLTFVPLSFDPEAFMRYVVDWELADDEAEQLLRMIWDIVVGFVDLGFGLPGSVVPVERSFLDSSSVPSDASIVISSDQSIRSNREHEPAAATRAAAKEDS